MKPAMERTLGAVALLGVLLAPSAAGAAPSMERFTPGTPYYFEHFDPSRQPWDPGQDLNFEEVFKNYQYYEIVFERSGQEITVKRFIQNLKDGSESYLLMPDRSLRKK